MPLDNSSLSLIQFSLFDPFNILHYCNNEQNKNKLTNKSIWIQSINRDYFDELSKFGRLEALHVCDNLGDHMIGHVYAKFSDEEEAADALNIMNGRYYDGRRMEVEFSPVTDFREARCRDFDEDTCRRGGFCNFMHIKPVPMCLIRDMEIDAEEERRREEMDRMERERRERKRKERKTREGGSGDGGGGGDHRRSSRRERGERSSRRGGVSGGGGSGGGGDSRSRSRSRDRSRSDSRSHKRRSRDRSDSGGGADAK